MIGVLAGSSVSIVTTERMPSVNCYLTGFQRHNTVTQFKQHRGVIEAQHGHTVQATKSGTTRPHSSDNKEWHNTVTQFRQQREAQ